MANDPAHRTPNRAARLLKALVRGYQLMLSAWIGPCCRYEPTCSAYALQALDRHGASAGTYLAAYRILRCNPLCLGGRDPVPENAPALFGFAHNGLALRLRRLAGHVMTRFGTRLNFHRDRQPTSWQRPPQPPTSKPSSHD